MNRLPLWLSMLVIAAGCESSGGEPSAASHADAASQPDTLAQASGAPHAPPCGPDEFLYDDKACSPPSASYPDPSNPHCTQMGDGWCYAICKQGGSCAGGFGCYEKTLCGGSDYCTDKIYICNGSLQAPEGAPCRSTYVDDCNAPATCSLATSTDCSDASTCEKMVCHL